MNFRLSHIIPVAFLLFLTSSCEKPEKQWRFERKIMLPEESRPLALAKDGETLWFSDPDYFRLYKKLSGMTGTAMTESEEFFDIYKLNVVSIPTNKKMLRQDFNDQIFRTEKEKYNAITNKIIDCNSKGQPVLVGTTSIEKSEKISKFLEEKKN